MRNIIMILAFGAFLLCTGCDGGGGSSGNYSANDAFRWSLCIKRQEHFQGTILNNNQDYQSELGRDAMGLWCWEADCVSLISEILDEEQNDSDEIKETKAALNAFFDGMQNLCGECREDRVPPPNIKPKIDALCEQTPNPLETRET